MGAYDTIFLVDASPASRHALWMRLARRRRALRLFGDARSALAALDREKPALVVADLDLPDVDGVALLAEMRRRLPVVLSVLVTGTEAPVGARLALQDRIIDAMVSRPVDRLDGVVERLLREPWEEWRPIGVRAEGRGARPRDGAERSSPSRPAGDARLLVTLRDLPRVRTDAQPVDLPEREARVA